MGSVETFSRGYFWFGGIFEGEGYRGGSFHEGTSHGGRDFQLRRRRIFYHYLKNNEK